MICQICGCEAPTRYCELYQNIGVLVMRFTRSVKGNMCKNCIDCHFWSMTGTNLLLGWWGMISFIITPFFIINNIVRFAMTRGLEAPSPGASAPRLTPEAIDKLSPYAGQIMQRLSAREKLAVVAPDIARMAGVTPGQVILFAAEIVRAAKSGGGVSRPKSACDPD